VYQAERPNEDESLRVFIQLSSLILMPLTGLNRAPHSLSLMNALAKSSKNAPSSSAYLRAEARRTTRGNSFGVHGSGFRGLDTEGCRMIGFWILKVVG